MDIKSAIQKAKQTKLLKSNPEVKAIAEIVVSQMLESIVPELNQKVENAIIEMQDKIDEIELQEGLQGEPGEKGDKGDKGEQGEKGLNGKDGINGVDGKNGLNGKDGKNGIDGKDGKNGKDGKDGSPDTPLQIANKLNTLEEKVDIKVIKGLKKWLESVNKSARAVRGGGMGNVQHETTAISASTTYVDTTYNIAGSGYAIFVCGYQGQILERGVHYTVSGKRITLLFTPEDSTYFYVVYVRG